MKPLISVIIPLYNNGPYLGRCLDSVLNQPYKNVEIIIIDDGSTDNGFEVASSYAEKHSNIKAFHFENAGVSIARNRGMKCATGKWLAFLDPDDTWVENCLNEKLLNELDKDYDLIHCGCFVSDGKNIVATWTVSEKEVLKGSWEHIKRDGSACPILFKNDFIKHFNIHFKEKCRAAEDLTFVGIACYCAEKRKFIDNPLFIYWIDNSTSTTHTISNFFERFYHSYCARLWEAEEAISKKSYGPESDEKVRKYCKFLAYGAVFEMLTEHFSVSTDINFAINEIKRLGLYEIVENNGYGIDSDLEKKFKFFNKHPIIFMIKYRIRYIIGRTIRKTVPQRLIKGIRKRYLKGW